MTPEINEIEDANAQDLEQAIERLESACVDWGMAMAELAQNPSKELQAKCVKHQQEVEGCRGEVFLLLVSR